MNDYKKEAPSFFVISEQYDPVRDGKVLLLCLGPHNNGLKGPLVFVKNRDYDGYSWVLYGGYSLKGQVEEAACPLCLEKAKEEKSRRENEQTQDLEERMQIAVVDTERTLIEQF